jgi:hypothetical protein
VNAKTFLWTKTRRFNLPALLVQKSSIPSSGLGVFANCFIQKNHYITIYGGKYMDAKQAQALVCKSHLRTIESRHTAVDAASSENNNTFTHKDLADKHMVGGIVNGVGTNKQYKRNAEYTSITTEYPFPRVDTNSTINSTTHLMIRAGKEDIKKGEEILVNYGTHYNGVFLNPALE